MENFRSACVGNLEFTDGNTKKIFFQISEFSLGGAGGCGIGGGSKKEELNKKTECEQNFSTVIVKGKTRDVYN